MYFEDKGEGKQNNSLWQNFDQKVEYRNIDKEAMTHKILTLLLKLLVQILWGDSICALKH